MAGIHNPLRHKRGGRGVAGRSAVMGSPARNLLIQLFNRPLRIKYSLTFLVTPASFSWISTAYVVEIPPYIAKRTWIPHCTATDALLWNYWRLGPPKTKRLSRSCARRMFFQGTIIFCSETSWDKRETWPRQNPVGIAPATSTLLETGYTASSSTCVAEDSISLGRCHARSIHTFNRHFQDRALGR